MAITAFAYSHVEAAAPAPGFPDYIIYRGNTHAHTTFTSSHGQKPPLNGPPSEHHRLAKGAGYDFYVTADHSHEKIFLPTRLDNPGWVAAKQQAAEATDERFIGLAGFEYTENDGGPHPGKCHINVINSDDYLDAAAPGVDLPYLYRWLKEVAANSARGGGPVVATFNHPIDKVYPMTTWDYRDDGVTDIITMLEVINASEYIHEAGFQAALAAGWKVSPVSGNDHHNFAGITGLPARTFVVATELSKRGLLEAMRQRRTYASLEQNLACCYSVNQAIMGSTLARPDKFEFAIYATDPDPEDRITKIEILKGSGIAAEVVATKTFDQSSVEWHPVITDTTAKYFYVRITNATGGDTRIANPANPVAWLAPVWTGR